jgi:hypothetical protein
VEQISRNILKTEFITPLIFLYNLRLDIPFTPTQFQKLWPKEILINSFLVQNVIFVCCRLGHIVTIATHILLLSNDYAWIIKITQAFLLPKNPHFTKIANIKHHCEDIIFRCRFFTSVGSHLKLTNISPNTRAIFQLLQSCNFLYKYTILNSDKVLNPFSKLRAQIAQK